ncbi:MAG: hypothetical protein HY749_20310 [Gammaproteobacteria bacterium]|nr:hypothetical protein [Gammaproteobacteria bacterium]
MRFSSVAVGGLLLLVSATSRGVDWNLLAEHAPLEEGIEGTAFYDKDSIAYPGETKGITAVWVRYVVAGRDATKNFVHLDCRRREVTVKSAIVDGRYVYNAPFLNRPFGIEPGTTDERLFNALCK